jgi:hypothetical protein
MALIVDSNLTVNGSTEEGTIINPNNGVSPFQVVYASGSFGGGTLTVEISNDGGTSWFDATNSVGAVTFTASGAERLFLLGNANNVLAKKIKVRCTLAGATSPNINVSIADCR